MRHKCSLLYSAVSFFVEPGILRGVKKHSGEDISLARVLLLSAE